MIVAIMRQIHPRVACGMMTILSRQMHVVFVRLGLRLMTKIVQTKSATVIMTTMDK